MKTEYLYVRLDRAGECSRIVAKGLEKVSLAGLLAEGWRPIRETPFTQTNEILICLEREPEGQMGFGFGP